MIIILFYSKGRFTYNGKEPDIELESIGREDYGVWLRLKIK